MRVLARVRCEGTAVVGAGVVGVSVVLVGARVMVVGPVVVVVGARVMEVGAFVGASVGDIVMPSMTSTEALWAGMPNIAPLPASTPPRHL